MTASLRLHNIPDTIRAQYDTLPQGLETAHMAKEVPRQYQRNSEDLQLLKFPSTKTILWDHASTGEPHTLHASFYRKPRLCVAEKVLRFAQRHVESTGQNSCSSVLVGSLTVTDDGQGIVFNVERLDPAGDPNMSSSHAAGDMLIPFTVQSGSKERGSNLEEYCNALQLLKQRCCSKDPIELANFLPMKGWCSIYTGAADKCVHHLEFDVVTMATEIKAAPIGPVPIVPTALSKNLSGPMSISLMQGVPKTGYLTMDHTRKLLLVLESDPKVTTLPLVGIWVSGVSYAYSPYVWACCLRFLHNSTIQDRVCSPPEPFLLVLYNPTHTRPEFYECSTASGTSTLQFDLYSGYEAVQINKTGVCSGETVEVELDAINTGRKRDTFEQAVHKFSASTSLDDSRRLSSPELSRHDDSTPRLQLAAPKASIVQSRVPEVPDVTLFFGDDDTFVPNVQHPRGGPPARRTLSEPHQPMVPGPIQQSTSHMPTVNTRCLQGGAATANSDRNRDIQNVHQQMRTSYGGMNSNQLPVSSTGAPAHSTSGSFQPRQSQAVALSTQYSPEASHAPVALPSQSAQTLMPISHSQNAPTSQAPVPHPQLPSSHPHPRMAQHSYPVFPGAPASQGPRPGFCTCPNCPPRPPPFTGGRQPYNFPRGHAPRPTNSNYGPPPPRLTGPYHGYPPNSHHLGYSYPPSSGHPPYPHVNDESAPINVKPHPNVNAQAYGMNIHPQYGYQQQKLPSSSSAETVESSVPPTSHSQQPQPSSSQPMQPMNRMMSPPLPQSSGGAPALSKERAMSLDAQAQYAEGPKSAPVYRAADVRRSNPGSDNSTRSSDDSGLSFTPEKHNSPSNPSPKTMQVISRPVTEPSTAGVLSVPSANVNWDNVPPEIYQLLMRQDQQLKQMQAQIEILTAQQSLNTTVESQPSGNRSPQQAVISHEQPVPKNTIATNTSVGLMPNTEQVSACMQTSPQKRSCPNSLQNSRESSRSSQPMLHRSLSQSTASSGSGCEPRTPMEIRHRGHQPMNSTHRHSEPELDMSQGEIVALMNNMHNQTYESERSEVELPSFQSSLTGLMQSEDSYETTFNTSQQSPISASMCDQQICDSDDSDYTDEDDDVGEEDNIEGTDTPKYYNKLMDNIKKLLNQNASADSTEDANGYHGDVSSDPSMPPDLAKEDIQLGQHLQSFLKYDEGDSSNNAAVATDMTFIPKINYVSMLLDSDTDMSMEMNGLAMKYLKDEELTALTKLQARNRLLQGPKHTAQKYTMLQKVLKAEDDHTPNVTAFGISPNDLTFETKKYMGKYGMLEGTVSGESTPGSESTYNESYQLKTNYSTMSSGSDGPAQITREILTTPTNQRTLPRHVTTPQNGQNCEGTYSNGTTPIRDSSNTRTPVNNAGPGGGINLTPRPNTVRSRTAQHKRFIPNASSPHDDSSIPSTQEKLFVQNAAIPRTNNDNFGAVGRFASPQITPAPNRLRHSPPQRETNSEPRRCVKELREEDERLARKRSEEQGRQAVLQKQKRNLENPSVPNFLNSRQETSGDDRILDISRLKQLPKFNH